MGHTAAGETALTVIEARREPGSRAVIGMLTHDLVEVFAEQWLGAVDAARVHGCDLICFCGRALEEPGYGRHSNDIYRLVTDRTLDAAVVWTSTLGVYVGQPRMASFARGLGRLPLVSVEQPLADAPVVVMDNRGGMSAVVSHLIEVHRRRRIAFIRGPATHDGAEDRFRGYLDALGRHGLAVDPDLISTAPTWWEPETAAAAVTRMLTLPQPPDAVAAANDDLAIGVLSALRLAGVGTPDEVAVVGYDDSTNILHHDLGFDSNGDDAGSVHRSVNVSAGTLALTTVRAPFHELGRLAVEIALRLSRGDPVPAVSSVDTQLVIRRSCGCLPTTSHHSTERLSNPADRVALVRRAMSHRSAHLPHRWAETLIAALTRESHGDPTGEFLRYFDDLVQVSLRDGESVENWWHALGALRLVVGAASGPTHPTEPTERLLTAAQALLNESAGRHSRYAQVLAEKRNQIVREVGQHLITAPDINALAQALADELPKLGIVSCYVASYHPVGQYDTARLQLAYEDGQRLDIGADPPTFVATDLLPEQRLRRLTPQSLVAVPLSFHGQALGFALFTLGPRIGWIYPAIQDQLASALHRAYMAEREQRTLSELRQEIRQRQQAEQALHQVHTELEQRVRDRTAELARANDTLTEQIIERERAERQQDSLQAQLWQAQKMEAMGRLAGGVAHDFNNLLLVINGNCEAVLKALRPDDLVRPDIEDVAHAGQRAATLTRQLLAFSRQQRRHPGAVNLNEVIDNIQAMLRRLIGADIDLRTGLHADLGSVWADTGQIEQIVVNLAVNARDAMPDGGVLTVETDDINLDESRARQHLGLEPGRYVVLRVRDTGVGMDDEVQARLFEPFFTTKPPGKGTGLGLATIFGVVRQSGGYIIVDSVPGAGSTFEIYFPPLMQQPTEIPEAAVPRPVPHGTETILLVEDNAEVRRAARRFLVGYGYHVVEAVDGTDALRLVRQPSSRFDLVITDVVMPEMGGRELVGHLTRLQPGTPVLYISGYADSSALGGEIISPAVGLLHKPFTAETLAGTVREILDRRASS